METTGLISPCNWEYEEEEENMMLARKTLSNIEGVSDKSGEESDDANMVGTIVN